MNRILRAEFVGVVTLVTTAACGGLEDFASTRVAQGHANEGGLSLDAGTPPSFQPWCS